MLVVPTLCIKVLIDFSRGPRTSPSAIVRIDLQVRGERLDLGAVESRGSRGISIGVAVARIAAVGGVYLSFYLDASTAGCIVVVQALIFFVTVFVAPKGGIIARARGRRRAVVRAATDGGQVA